MEVEVEYLPTIGEAESIKTAKQGRRGYLNDLQFDPRLHRRCTETGAILSRSRDGYNRASVDFLKVCAFRIVNFKKSTERQRHFAKVWLEAKDPSYSKTLLKINNTLSKRFKDKYLDCNTKGVENE